MKKLLLSTLLVATTTLGFCDEPMKMMSGTELDKYIPVPVQKKYGINLLSPDQKEQIAEWLKALKLKPPTRISSNLSLNIDNGRYIQLDDGTVWQIDPSMLTISQGWLSPVKIDVIKTDSTDEYDYRLYNEATRNSVNAKRVTMKSIPQ